MWVLWLGLGRGRDVGVDWLEDGRYAFGACACVGWDR